MSAKDENLLAPLRRSSRSTRGSVKPIIDLKKNKELEEGSDHLEQVEDEDRVERDVDTDYKESKSKTKRVSNSGPKARTSTGGRKSKIDTSESSQIIPPPKATKKSAKGKSVNAETEETSSLEDEDVYTLNEKEMKEINSAFDLNCYSKEELMTSEEFKTALRSLGFEPRAEEINKLLKKYSNKDKKINRDGFQKVMAYKIGSSPGANETQTNDAISRVFNLLDLNKTGMITIDNLKSISKELNEDLTEEELREMIMEADQDGDFQINKEEFYDIMKKTSLY